MPSSIHTLLKARLLALPPRGFELFAGDLLEFIGLQQVKVTRYSGDGGIDATGAIEVGEALLSVPVGVQVKRHRRNNVQRSDIDRFVGALSGNYAQGIFITTAGYAPSARLKASSSMPRIATVDGAQLIALMLRHRLGVAGQDGLDEQYFGQFEAQAEVGPEPRSRDQRSAGTLDILDAHVSDPKQPLKRINEPGTPYEIGPGDAALVRPEDDLITMRALSHALRVDTTVLRRWMERGKLVPDSVARDGGSGYFFSPRPYRSDSQRSAGQGASCRQRELATGIHGVRA
ncbi:restriction endonuclease [Candidatus Gracilibacteria bacterium]|nr:restriction endonuclease [Candidatus Gracilibacteria bacterium]